MEKEIFTFYRNALMGTNMIEPLCEEYKTKWKLCHDNKEELIRLSLNQQSIPYFASMCYLGRGVSKGYLLAEYGHLINGVDILDADGVKGYKYGLFVDYNEDNPIIADKDVIHVMWTNGAEIVIPKTKCPTIYLSNESNVKIVCDGYNMPRIYLFDKSAVEIDDADEHTKVTAYKYNEGCNVTRGRYCFGEVKEFSKELRI